MSQAPSPAPTETVIADIEKRHANDMNDLDRVERPAFWRGGQQAHQDRATLLAYIKSLTADRDMWQELVGMNRTRPVIADREALAFEAGAKAMREACASYVETYDGSVLADGVSALSLPAFHPPKEQTK